MSWRTHARACRGRSWWVPRAAGRVRTHHGDCARGASKRFGGDLHGHETGRRRRRGCGDPHPAGALLAARRDHGGQRDRRTGRDSSSATTSRSDRRRRCRRSPRPRTSSRVPTGAAGPIGSAAARRPRRGLPRAGSSCWAPTAAGPAWSTCAASRTGSGAFGNASGTIVGVGLGRSQRLPPERNLEHHRAGRRDDQRDAPLRRLERSRARCPPARSSRLSPSTRRWS